MSDESPTSVAYAIVKPPQKIPWYWRIIRFPLTRILIWGPLIFIAAYMPSGMVLRAMGTTMQNANGLQMTLGILAALPGGVLLYWLLARFIEWRPMSDLSLRGAPLELALGIGLGVGLLSVIMGIIALSGGYRITGVNAPSIMLASLVVGIIPGVVEELVFRGVLYRIVEESLGTWLSTLISAMLFGFMHAFNPNATMLANISIAISAGPLLAWAYIMTRRLWICIGIHFAWNFTLGGVYGAPVSGNVVPGLFSSELSGPELISGGAFGPEASVITMVAALALSIALYVVAAKRGHVIKPFWRRPRNEASSALSAPSTS